MEKYGTYRILKCETCNMQIEVSEGAYKETEFTKYAADDHQHKWKEITNAV